MTGLYWKSDAAVTVIRPLLKGTGDPPELIRLNGIGGVRFQKTRIEFSIRVFLR